MNEFLTHVIKVLSARVEGIQAMILRGSQQNHQVVDMWSDYDILMVLNPSTSIDESEFLNAVNDIGFVVGSESYGGENSILCRVAVEFEGSLQLLDISGCSYQEWATTAPPESQEIVLGNIELSPVRRMPRVTDEVFKADDRNINPTWFKYLMTIKKFCRDDNLIGMHLLLDLVREYLVLRMVTRDNLHKTSIHRFGDNEHLPDSIKLSQIDDSDKEKILDYIARLAYEYDEQLVSMVEGYTSRYSLIQDYINHSKACLRDR
jgi:hypothetical protein